MSTRMERDQLGLCQGRYYLVRAPLWSDSGYIIACLDSIDDGVPVFVEEQGGREVPNEDIDGWRLLER